MPMAMTIHYSSGVSQAVTCRSTHANVTCPKSQHTCLHASRKAQDVLIFLNRSLQYKALEADMEKGHSDLRLDPNTLLDPSLRVTGLSIVKK